MQRPLQHVGFVPKAAIAADPPIGSYGNKRINPFMR
jgi:hypothetical protein